MARFRSPCSCPYPGLYFHPVEIIFPGDVDDAKRIFLGDGVCEKLGRAWGTKDEPNIRNGLFNSRVVSRQHAKVWENDGKIFIKDTGSSYGTYVNGRRLSAESVESEPCELKSEDIVQLGIDRFDDGNRKIRDYKVTLRVLVAFTPKDAFAAARGENLHSRHVTESTAQTASVIESESASSDCPIDGAPHSPSTLPTHSVEIGSLATTDTTTRIGTQTAAEEVVLCLVAHGCQDLTHTIDLATFGNHPISEGGFGNIYRGRTLDGTQVAIKTLKIFVGATNQDLKALKHTAKELHTWSKCKHPNVLELLGLAVFRDRIGMVAPWMDDGNLPKYLERVPDVNRCKLCAQICDGLSYLHDIGIVHGDLKGTNVLISGDGKPLLTDFGNSVLAERTLQFTQTTEKNSMTMRWSAPELIKGSGAHSKAADVYALGMTLLEAMTGMPPYHDKLERSIIYTVVVKRELPGRPEEYIPTNSEDGNKLWGLLVTCWSFEPEERPSAAVVAQTVETITHGGLMPIKAS